MFTNQLLQGTGHKQIGAVAPEYAYLDKIVDRMVRQSPAERPSSIAEIREALPRGMRAVDPTSPNLTEQTGHEAEPGTLVNGSAHAGNDNLGDVFERLRRHIYDLADSRYPEAIHLAPYKLSTQFGLAVGYVTELLEELHREGCVSIARWDGTRECPLNEWSSSSSFFESTDDGAYVRVRMRRRGKQHLEQMRATPLNR
jgi:hypothetical protein